MRGDPDYVHPMLLGGKTDAANNPSRGEMPGKYTGSPNECHARKQAMDGVSALALAANEFQAKFPESLLLRCTNELYGIQLTNELYLQSRRSCRVSPPVQVGLIQVLTLDSGHIQDPFPGRPAQSAHNEPTSARRVFWHGEKNIVNLPTMGDTSPTKRQASPLRATRLRSTFGAQPLSTKETMPAFGFGSSSRSSAEKQYITSEHAKSGYGMNSPGPVYDRPSSIGPQKTSNEENAPEFSFGSSSRFTKNNSGAVPGPGAYGLHSTLGKQVISEKRSAGTFHFGSSTRDHAAKQFTSVEHEKAQFGNNSPGPSAYETLSSIGAQPLATKKNAPGWAFPSSQRFKGTENPNKAKEPGAGAYDSVPGIGKQPVSTRTSPATFSFGSSDRDGRSKVYISPDHEKSSFGLSSPGPTTSPTKSSLGVQALSAKKSGAAWGFGSSRRFVYTDTASPGPGAYD
eukprot:jgi/Mesvir1/26483/Mv16152-RA.1